ncbi:MAG: hypothetical protein JJ992_02125, partial [Planctomycetes bacterium]|nr:hypothetical protein [Planctomycetota bacterium]
MTDYATRRVVMVDTQVRPSDVTKFPIIEAMLSVPRETFVPDAWREAAYAGENIPLGGGRVVLEPRTLAKMLDALNVDNDELVLDVGCGLGYSSAVVARMAQAVIAIEEDAAAHQRTPVPSCTMRVPCGLKANGTSLRSESAARRPSWC